MGLEQVLRLRVSVDLEPLALIQVLEQDSI